MYNGKKIILFIDEYIIMDYIVHMHIPSLWKIQCNSAHPCFIADSCTDCVLRHALSPSKFNKLICSFASSG